MGNGSDSATLILHQQVLTNYAALYTTGRLSDVKIMVGDSVFNVHRLILAAQSRFFEAMFFNSSMIESNTDEIQLKETDPEVFNLLLELVYNGSLEKAKFLDPETLIVLYILIERYQFIDYESYLLQEIQNKVINFDNFWKFLDTAVFYNNKALMESCFKFLEIYEKNFNLLQTYEKKFTKNNLLQNFKQDLFSHSSFINISYETLSTLLDTNFNIYEMRLLTATLKWIEYNSSIDERSYFLLKKIRLCLITEEDLLTCVNLRFVINTDLIEALNMINRYFANILNRYIEHTFEVKNSDRKYSKFYKKALSSIVLQRSIAIENFNVCQEEFGFKMNALKNEDYCLSTCKDTDKPIKIIVNLGFPYLLNYIEMTMSDVRGDKFSYLIEYSVDSYNWNTLYDYRKYLCSNHQTLFFNPIVCKYFRIQGFHQIRMDSRTRKVFETIKSFKAFYQDFNTKIDVRLVDGILLTSFYAFQIQHRVYCDSTIETPTLSHRYYKNRLSFCYDDSESYVFSGANKFFFKPIVVLLDQPIMLSSFQFQLYDIDDRAYSYVVEILDQDKWTCVADRSNEACRSWQTIIFSLRPVNLIRIRGIKIYNSEAKEFCIIKFDFSKNNLDQATF